MYVKKQAKLTDISIKNTQKVNCEKNVHEVIDILHCIKDFFFVVITYSVFLEYIGKL